VRDGWLLSNSWRCCWWCRGWRCCCRSQRWRCRLGRYLWCNRYLILAFSTFALERRLHRRQVQRMVVPAGNNNAFFQSGILVHASHHVGYVPILSSSRAIKAHGVNGSIVDKVGGEGCGTGIHGGGIGHIGYGHGNIYTICIIHANS